MPSPFSPQIMTPKIDPPPLPATPFYFKDDGLTHAGVDYIYNDVLAHLPSGIRLHMKGPRELLSVPIMTFFSLPAASPAKVLLTKPPRRGSGPMGHVSQRHVIR